MIDLIVSANETADYNYVVERIRRSGELMSEFAMANSSIERFLSERGVRDYPISSKRARKKKTLYEMITSYMALGGLSFSTLEDYGLEEMLADIHAALSIPIPIESAPATPLAELRLPSIVHNALCRKNITTVEKLASCTKAEILSIHHIGQRYVEIISEALAAKGLELRKEGD